MKTIKIFLIVLLVLCLIIAVAIIGLSINHQNKLKKEAKLYSLMGEMIEVSGKRMHLFKQGTGDQTLIFMAGHGTSSPTLDFKPLWSKLKNDYQIVVIEKFGYGFSDVSNHKKDLDTQLEHTRLALSSLNLEPPYVLMPHSYSGLEAIFWSIKYPNEIKAIIGVDPLVPKAIDLLPIPPKTQLNLISFVSRIGVNRFIPKNDLVNVLPLLSLDIFSEHEKGMYTSMFYKSSLTKDMLNELSYMKAHRETLLSLTMPIDLPIYAFISSQQDLDVPGWKHAILTFLNHFEHHQSYELDVSHYMHHEASDIMIDEIKTFLSMLSM